MEKNLIIANKNTEFLENCKLEFNYNKFTIKLCSCSEELIYSALEQEPFMVIINTNLDYPDALTAIDMINKKYNSRVSIVVILENDSFRLQEEVVKRNVLLKLFEPVEFTDLKEIIESIAINKSIEL